MTSRGPAHQVRVRRSAWRGIPVAAHRALILGILIRILVVGFIHGVHGPFLFLDDRAYDQVGWKIASAWRHGSFPHVNSIDYAGTATYGYYVWVAAIYFIVGHMTIAVGVVNAIVSGFSVVLVFRLGEVLGGPTVARRAAWAVALYPIAIFWGATGLKDGPELTLFLALVVLPVLGLTRRRVVLLCVLLVGAFITRPPLAAAAIVVCVGELLSSSFAVKRRRHNSPGVTRGIIAVIGLTAVALLAAHFVRVYRHSAILATQASGAHQPLFSARGFGIVPLGRALLGPFPWEFSTGSSGPYRWLYPGMVIWIAVLPAATRGAWLLIRHGSLASRLVIVATALYGALYLTYVPYETGFFRQRFEIEVIGLVCSLVAVDRDGVDATVALCAAWVVVVSVAVALYTAIIPIAGLALTLLAITGITGVRYSARRRKSMPKKL